MALASCVRTCTACARSGGPRVLGTGYPRADVMLLRGAPAPDDVASGLAFAAEAEPLLAAFEALGLPPTALYGTVAVRCGDRPARPEEVGACAPHLLWEIEAVAPHLVVAFGPQAAAALEALDGRCGLRVPSPLARSEPVRVRTDLIVVVTESLPEGVRVAEAKRRLWRDLRRGVAALRNA